MLAATTVTVTTTVAPLPLRPRRLSTHHRFVQRRCAPVFLRPSAVCASVTVAVRAAAIAPLLCQRFHIPVLALPSRLAPPSRPVPRRDLRPCCNPHPRRHCDRQHRSHSVAFLPSRCSLVPCLFPCLFPVAHRAPAVVLILRIFCSIIIVIFPREIHPKQKAM